MTEKEKKESSRQYYWFWIVSIVISILFFGLGNTIVGFGCFIVIIIMLVFTLMYGVVLICFIPYYIIDSLLEKFSFRMDLKDFLNEKSDDIFEFIILYILPIVFLSGFIFDIYPHIGGEGKRTCYDKTSIDYNRQNDVKCVNERGEVKWTDYAGARKLMGK